GPQANRHFKNDADHREDVAEFDRCHQVHTQRATSSRAQRSTSSSFSSVGSGSKWCASSTLRHAGTISVKCSSPCKNASTAASFAEWRTGGVGAGGRGQ